MFWSNIVFWCSSRLAEDSCWWEVRFYITSNGGIQCRSAPIKFCETVIWITLWSYTVCKCTNINIHHLLVRCFCVYFNNFNCRTKMGPLECSQTPRETTAQCNWKCTGMYFIVMFKINKVFWLFFTSIAFFLFFCATTARVRCDSSLWRLQAVYCTGQSRNTECAL